MGTWYLILVIAAIALNTANFYMYFKYKFLTNLCVGCFGVAAITVGTKSLIIEGV
jgi:hypothetical protein